MTKNKFPYIGYNEKEIKVMELNGFNLQFGDDFLLEDGRYLFNHSEISKMYKKALRDIVEVIETGSEKEKRFAINLLGSLIVRPMRFH